MIQANLDGEINTKTSNDSNNEKSYKKTHTPTSLFMRVYQYLNENKKIAKLENFADIDNVNSGDFVEINSNIELNTIVEFFETLDKVIDITEAFSSFATIDSKKTIKKSPLSNMKKPVESTLKALVNENNNVKYGDPNTFAEVKEALNAIPNINFKEFKDIVAGKTIVIMPIAIGI